MGDIPDHLVPIIAGWFFVVTAVEGICLYCCYMKTRKDRTKRDGQTTNNVKRSYGAHGKSGQLSSYKLHSNPFFFYMGPAAFEFNSTPLTIETESEGNLKSPCYFEQEHCKLPDRKRVCRSTRCDKSVRSPCHLQVIAEAEEENEEEANKTESEATNV